MDDEVTPPSQEQIPLLFLYTKQNLESCEL